MGKIKYYNKAPIAYYSKRYKKYIFIPQGYGSDGATFACDIYSDAWWVHDWLCDKGVFADGTKCTNWQASQILSDILRKEGRWARAIYWKHFTFLFGGKKLKKENGWIKLKEGKK